MSDLACSVVQADLVAWLDGELPEERATAVRVHVASCAACEAERAALSGSWKALDLLPGFAPRAGLFAEIEARVRAEAAGIEAAGAEARAPAEGASSGQPGPEGRVLRFPFAARAAGLAAALLITGGLGFGLTRLILPAPAPSGGSLAAQPLPSAEALPDPVDMGAPRPPQVAQVDPEADPREPSEPRRKVPSEQRPQDEPRPPQAEEPRAPEVEVASLPEGWQALAPEERGVVENLELLMALDEVDDLEVIEALEVLEELSDEELGEG